MTAVTIATIGGPRLTMGFDRFDRIDLDRHRALHGALPTPDLEELLKITEAVDLRGRGGAAFPFARKLMAVASRVRSAGGDAELWLPGAEDDRDGSEAVVVVNGAEGEPGSQKDKVLLTRNPHLVLDGAQIAASALGTRDIVVAVESGAAARAVRTALAERRMDAEIVRLPERFISGESGAVVRAVNGQIPIPPGRKVRAAESGVDGRPTLLSNTETFAQLAVLASLGPDLYSTAGTDSEPGTTLLTIGGSTVVEVPLGTPLSTVFAECGVEPGQGVLVGGYHGEWITPDAARSAVVSRAGFKAVGGSLGAGIILPLPEGTCPLREVARIAAYMAGQSAGQCGPCRLGLPDLYRSLENLVDGSGTPEQVRRAAAVGRGRGACSHPDGTARFALSALTAFAADIETHRLNGTCNQPCFGVLPLPVPTGGEAKVTIDWSRCQGHGLCAYLLPELIQLDRYGYPVVLNTEIPTWMETDANRAVAMCPALALRLTPTMTKPTRK
ncbi:NADH-quinone oxidoreductase subunit NuoF family protein [Thermomonospora amylolytica]|uniref:NADH-quinone oxidoreductase subunit NuoF family protein n=1 Tax=Thermomonospora amylolytica TaxID=1411117 RepID=UPI000E6CCE42|nr:NADH-quinone oxidoreductase subunit NuoF family protein [Thermomonospora amylolytica]